MNENDLTNDIVSLLRKCGIWCYRTHRPLFPPPPENKGIADICGIYQGKPLYIEIKGPRAKTHQEQLNFLKNAIDQGAIAFVADSFDIIVDQLGLNVLF